MANSNPITSHDLYQPGQEDTLRKLIVQLQAIQDEIREINSAARTLRDSLKALNAANSPAKVVAAATEAQRINNEKQRLAVKQQLALDKMRQVSAAQTASQITKSEQQQQREIEKTRQQMLRTQIVANNLAKSKIQLANASKHTSSSFTGLLGSIRNLAYAYFSLGAATQVFQSILKQTKALDTLTVAFNTTLGSTQATAQAQEYLLDISERFGANLLGASQAYLKFSAASTQAGVSAQQTQDIFTSVTKASSILGLGAERTSYVFLALEQIMSKGRLSTEELRRQLGEHLPGAFGIAAEAMGVTTAKLTDMLKKGEIASTDFLPKFAKQLELAYGIDQVERIDNLAAAQERFNNQLTLLIKDLDLSDAFKDLFNNLASLVKVLADNASGIVTLGKALFQLGLAWAAWKTAMIITNGLQAVNIGLLRRAIRMNGLFATATTLAGRAVRSLSAAIAANPLGAFLTVVILLWPQINRLADSIRGITEGARAMSDSLGDMTVSVIEETSAVKKNIEVIGDLNSTQEQRLSAFNDLQAAYPGILNSYDLEKIALTDLVTLEKELTTAIVERAKASRKADIQTDLLKALEEANRAEAFAPLNTKEGKEQQTINLRENLRTQAFALAQEKLDALDQASLDLNQFLQEQIKAGDTIVQREALRLQYRAKEVELQKELNALTDDQLLTITETEKAKGRSFGQVDPFFDLRQNIAKEILAKRKKPDELDGGGSGKGKKEKDPRIVAIERLIALNELEEDSLKQRLDTIRLANEKEKILHENDNEYLLALEQSFQRELFDVQVKYLKEKQDKREEESARERADFERATNDVKDYLEKRRQAIEAAENKRQSNVDALRDEFDARRKHEEDIFDLTKHSEEEIADFKLKLKIDELNDEIQLHRIFGKVLSDEELARAIELRDKMQAALDDPNTAGTEKGETDIFSLLNINFDSPEQKEALIDALDFAKQQLTDFLDFQKEIIDQEIENADRKVRAAEENLNRQIALQTANQASNVAGAQAELALAKKTQDEALKQRQKFQKTELALNTALEASNLTVAIAKTLAIFPGPVGIALAAAMIGAFAAAKIKAFQLANKKTFRKGGFEVIKGGSHESGNDTHVGGNNYAEKEESVGIFTAKATRKYKPTLKALVNAANKGTLENILVQDRRAIQGINVVNKTDIDTSLMEKRLTRLVSLSEAKTFVDGRGRLVRIDRGRTTIINK